MTASWSDPETPGVFSVELGLDFPKALLRGLEARLANASPEDWARVEIIVNTRRMQRRVTEVFLQGPPRLLPTIRLLADLPAHPLVGPLPETVSDLSRQLEIAQLVRALLDARPGLAPKAAAFDLARSLTELLKEMHGEDVPFERLEALRPDDLGLSEYWRRSLEFLNLVGRYLDSETEPLDAEALQRAAVERLGAVWQETPPEHPVILAGSTGSRGTTALLMEHIAKLPQGAVILPGVDAHLTEADWARLDDPRTAEDHPQFRFADLMRRLGIRAAQIRPWDATATPTAPVAARAALLSLALRPAPVTDRWRTDGPKLKALDAALADVTLIEAPDPRSEALAIAERLRIAHRAGRTAALITPDRILARRVTAALDRWRILPDDSAGRPLLLSAPGRFLRHVAEARISPPEPASLMVLLKHPLSHSGRPDRGAHLLRARELELYMRRNAPFRVSFETLRDWRDAQSDPALDAWVDWISDCFLGERRGAPQPLSTHVTGHLELAARIAAGPDAEGSGALWEEDAGAVAESAMASLRDAAEAGGELTSVEYASLLATHFAGQEVRTTRPVHSPIKIWGTLEARVQGADLVVLAGLDDGVWPAAPAPDPWLSRPLRYEAGLLLPERQIGLSGHDFQIAALAPEVVLSRSLRDAEAQTVPSRWLNRITNLLNGLPDLGKPALDAARDRGQALIAAGLAQDTPDAEVPPETRPAPVPPPQALPDRLSVTQIKTLIRDPYAIYAKKILRLEPLSDLDPTPDARLRGTLMHRVLELGFRSALETGAPPEPAGLHRIAQEVLSANVDHPAVRTLWGTRWATVLSWLVAQEVARADGSALVALEARCAGTTPGGFRLTGEADRIDRLPDGSIAIYDYKTGVVPTVRDVAHFDKQLPLEAALAEAGGFVEIGAKTVSKLAYIGLGSSLMEREIPLSDATLQEVMEGLDQLLARYRTGALGFTARRGLQRAGDVSDYDHLARLGEWDVTDPPVKLDLA